MPNTQTINCNKLDLKFLLEFLKCSKNDYHREIKHAIIGDFEIELTTERINRNPDIGFCDGTENICFKDVLTRKSFCTGFPLIDYRND